MSLLGKDRPSRAVVVARNDDATRFAVFVGDLVYEGVLVHETTSLHLANDVALRLAWHTRSRFCGIDPGVLDMAAILVKKEEGDST